MRGAIAQPDLTPLHRLAEDGFAVVEKVLEDQEVAELIRFTDCLGSGPGVRNLLDYPLLRAVAESPAIQLLVTASLGPGARVVRGILFDKTSAANWKVPWHQDVTIAVSERVEADGFGPWSIKAGVLHVQPPAEVLERMISVRLHLDDCPEENGALRVIAGSHRAGKLTDHETRMAVEQSTGVVCEVRPGGALLMRPLLLHASSSARVAGHRRVLHFDYAWGDLPGGLSWAVDAAP